MNETQLSRSQQEVVSRIVTSLKADPRRAIYAAWKYPYEFYITFQGGGPFPREVVLQMVDAGLLQHEFPPPLVDCYVLPANAKLTDGADKNV